MHVRLQFLIFFKFIFLELSEVLWHMVLMPSFHTSGTLAPLHIFISFFCFFILTVVILVIMEGLSAFLHVLRLHW